MKKPKKDPRFIQIEEYADFRKYINGFVHGHYKFLWILGDPGIGKTKSLQIATKDIDCKVIKAGQLTPLAFYEQLYYNVDKPIILDDAEEVLSQPVGINIVNSLTQTEEVKTLTYFTSNNYLDKRDIPQTFDTKSNLCILSNQWRGNNAIADRARLVQFKPDKERIHKENDWIKEKDAEVYEWFGKNLADFDDEEFSIRAYMKAMQDKNAGHDDWQHITIKAIGWDRDMMTLKEILADKKLKTEAQRQFAFTERTGNSRATYFRYKQRLKK